MHERFYGIGEPLIQRQKDQGIDAAAYLDLVKGLGCSAAALSRTRSED